MHAMLSKWAPPLERSKMVTSVYAGRTSFYAGRLEEPLFMQVEPLFMQAEPLFKQVGLDLT